MAIIFGKRNGYLLSKGWGASITLALLLLPISIAAVYGRYVVNAGYLGLAIELVLFGIFLSGALRTKRTLERISQGIDGEDQVIGELKKLPDEYAVMRGIMVREHLDIDSVVIGPTGVYAIEVKSHRGAIGFNGYKLTRNGRPFEKDFIRQVSTEAVLLREKIRTVAKLDLFVSALLVFSSRSATVNFGTQKIGQCRIIKREWLNEVLQAGSGQMLDAKFIFQIVNALVSEISDDKKEEKLAKLRSSLFLDVTSSPPPLGEGREG